MPISASPERILVKPPPRNHSLAPSAISGLPITEDDDWVTLPPATPNSGLPKTPPDNRRHSLDSHSRDPTPSPPPKSFRNSFTHGLKRLSLNGSISRSPSIGGRRSLSHSRNGSTSSTLPPLPNDAVLSFSPTPSPSPPPMTPPPESPYKVIQPHAHRRIRDPAPAALFCHEVYTTRSASERCMIYAKKINELYLYDCGLGDWLFEAKIHGPTSSVSVISTSETPRKISHGSTMSEVTFPRRPDASLATDLTIRDPVDVTPPRGPPALPYPSLAGQRANPPKSTTSGSFASLLSGGGHASGGSSPSKQTPSKGGFFATLGRRTSVSKRDRGGGASGSSGSGRLTKPPPGSASAPPSATPLSVNKSLASIVGGPRAPPNRSSRAFTSGSMSDSPASSRQSTMLAKRPSLYNIPSESAHSASSTQTQGRSPAQQDDPAFVAQVNKLSDLLPHVERDVLAGYLRRTGQDMLAIGQYLDDEKNGCVRRD
ncbi:hypothetical protein VNI00_000996 [Paramarasmius palmivorus]|uniref:Uncharacterized protein n=1 Tax=Paramarasmius palmivorus TaxID=297713 RepID=A0AAW0E9M6_9AGAR